jgi:hypothetical protein
LLLISIDSSKDRFERLFTGITITLFLGHSLFDDMDGISDVTVAHPEINRNRTENKADIVSIKLNGFFI